MFDFINSVNLFPEQQLVLLYRLHKEALPKEKLIKARELYQKANALDLKQFAMFQQISVLLRANNIPFCPIKGADLSWRVYPDGALRSMCDIDILIQKCDCQKVKELLISNKWRTPYEIPNESHLPPMQKNGVTLELHFAVSEFDAPAENLWQYMITENGVSRLPLEINLLLLFNHAKKHNWAEGGKLLLDAAFLIAKEGYPDIEKMREYAKAMNCSSAELLFAAYPEIFPDATGVKTFAPQVIAVFRKLFAKPMGEHTKIKERVLLAKNRFTLAWWKERLYGMSVASIRFQTNNPKGNYLKLLWGYCSVFAAKLSFFWHFKKERCDRSVAVRIDDIDFINRNL